VLVRGLSRSLAVFLGVVSTEDVPDDPHPHAWLAELAARVATADGDSHPSGAQCVLTTRQPAAETVSGARLSENQEVYLVLLRGNFVHTRFTGPSGASPPRGTVITFTADSMTRTIYDYGIGDRVPDLPALGRVTDLRLPETR
jgi:hypothetical protein